MGRRHLVALGQWFSEAWIALFRLVAPRRCLGCRQRTDEAHPAVCPHCYAQLLFTDWPARGHRMERMFWGQFPIGRAFALLYYAPETPTPAIIHHIKYRQDADAGRRLAEQMLRHLAHTDFFAEVDALVPIPLNKARERHRSFNQAHSIAQGVASLTGLPLWPHIVTRHTNNPSQTQVAIFERRSNVEGIFSVSSEADLRGKHLLLIDDVMTTGSTLTACARTLVAAGATRISILTLAVSTKLPHTIIRYKADEEG